MLLPDWTRTFRYGKADTDIDEIELADVPDGHLSLEQHSDLDIGGNVARAENPHHGWRRVILLASVVGTIVLIANIIFASITSFKSPTSKGVADIFQGDCGLVKRWNTALHLLVNILSTALLAASNYTMQCLNSPTRSDIDKAHSSGASLYIGIPSVTNFRYLPYWKALIWLALCSSTLPLHFFWNSMVFTTLVSYEMNLVTVNEDFLNETGSYHPNYTQCLTSHLQPTNPVSFIYDGYNAGQYVNISGTDCTSLVSDVGSSMKPRNVIAVLPYPVDLMTSQCNYTDQFIKNTQCNSTDQSPATTTATTYLRCGDYTDSDPELNQLFDIVDFTYNGYCYIDAQESGGGCILHYSSYLLYVVIVCNSIKVVCMFATARLLWKDGGAILATVGDATASFLESPDPTTQNRCVADEARGALKTHHTVSTATTYTREPSVRILKVAKIHWITNMIFCTTYVIIGLAVFPFQDDSVETLNLPGLTSSDGIGLVQMVMLANAPQVLLSLTYFLYNSLISAQCAALEWAAYTDKMQTLRVSWPRGDQRSTYWLSLPYRFGIPLTIGLIFMHFFLSQTIDISRIRSQDGMGHFIGGGIESTIVFNGKYMVGMCVIVTVLVQWQLLWGFTAFDNYIPYHKNQSAMISALCHMDDPYELGKQYSRQELRDFAAGSLTWGVTRKPVQFLDTRSGREEILPGHCSFSSQPVEQPVCGMRYE